MARTDLHLLLGESAGRCVGVGLCRRPGCSEDAVDGLGFCAPCRRRYDAESARRRTFVDVIVDRLTAAKDPLFTVFGGQRPRRFGAHVAAHLEELDARFVHVPPSAIDDYIAELDDAARGVA